MKEDRLTKTKVGFLFKLSSAWMGVHYSAYNKRYCINILPCLTIWIALKGGRIPRKEYSRKWKRIMAFINRVKRKRFNKNSTHRIYGDNFMTSHIKTGSGSSQISRRKFR